MSISDIGFHGNLSYNSMYGLPEDQLQDEALIKKCENSLTLKQMGVVFSIFSLIAIYFLATSKAILIFPLFTITLLILVTGSGKDHSSDIFFSNMFYNQLTQKP